MVSDSVAPSLESDLGAKRELAALCGARLGRRGRGAQLLDLREVPRALLLRRLAPTGELRLVPGGSMLVCVLCCWAVVERTEMPPNTSATP